MNKADLLSQLQIDRGPGPPPPGRADPWILIGLGSLAAVALVAALGWFLIARPDRPQVEAVAARAVTAESAPGATLLEASGYVVARRQATVSSKTTGRVEEVLIEEGQHVAKGQVIARLDASNVQAGYDQARAQVQEAQANLQVAQVAETNAGPKYRRNARLHEAGWLSDQAVDDSRAAYDSARYSLVAAQRQLAVARAGLEVAQRSLDDTVVRAPFDGVVTVKAAQPGETVSPISAGGGYTRTGIGTIVDMSSLEVQVDVAESYINRVQAGMPAEVRLNAYPDWKIPAEVTAVIPTADRSKATVTVRVGFKVQDPRIVPEMGAKVSFLSPEVKAAPARASRSVEIPAAAVQGSGADAVVFVVGDHGRLERRAVTLGSRSEDDQTVLGGLRPGDEVAVGDLSKLHDGMTVRLKAGGG
jgi:RND family efflux transporter MFP subunit